MRGGLGSVCNTQQNWLGSIRGRLGYAGINRVLVYATGGVAFTRYSFAETALLSAKLEQFIAHRLH